MIQQAGKLTAGQSTLEVFEVTDPAELAAAAIRRKHFDRNSFWLQEHIHDVYTPEHRGQFLCVSGCEAFIGDSVDEVVKKATAAHPDDLGWFTRYIPREKVPRIYADQR